MVTDPIFYQLFQTFPHLLFELIGHPSETGEGYSFSAKEIKELSFRFDGVFLPPTQNQDKLIYFVEVQFLAKYKKVFYWDLFAEISLYLKQYQPQQDWRAVAIFPDASLDAGPLVQYQEYFDSGRLFRIYLDRLPKETSDSIGLETTKLIVEPEAQAVEKARQLKAQARSRLTPDVEQKKILELIDKILVYKFPQLSKQELEAMFGVDDLRQTQYFKDVASEVDSKARREDILSVLEARFTFIPDGVVEKLNGISDLSLLKGLLRRASTVENLAQFQQALL